jgi:TerC family integral membrane protein
MSQDYQGTRFLTRVEGAVRATPLLAVLVVVETTDLLFALDSVPAIIGITTDKFLVYTSNVFAICALRSLYFALAGMMGRFRYLKAGLAALLVFIGGKLLLDPWIARALGHPLPVWVPLLVTLGCIGTAVAASFRVDSSASGDGNGGEREREGSHHA